MACVRLKIAFPIAGKEVSDTCDDSVLFFDENDLTAAILKREYAYPVKCACGDPGCDGSCRTSCEIVDPEWAVYEEDVWELSFPPSRRVVEICDIELEPACPVFSGLALSGFTSGAVGGILVKVGPVVVLSGIESEAQVGIIWNSTIANIHVVGLSGILNNSQVGAIGFTGGPEPEICAVMGKELSCEGQTKTARVVFCSNVPMTGEVYANDFSISGPYQVVAYHENYSWCHELEFPTLGTGVHFFYVRGYDVESNMYESDIHIFCVIPEITVEFDSDPVGSWVFDFVTVVDVAGDLNAGESEWVDVVNYIVVEQEHDPVITMDMFTPVEIFGSIPQAMTTEYFII